MFHIRSISIRRRRSRSTCSVSRIASQCMPCVPCTLSCASCISAADGAACVPGRAALRLRHGVQQTDAPEAQRPRHQEQGVAHRPLLVAALHRAKLRALGARLREQLRAPTAPRRCSRWISSSSARGTSISFATESISDTRLHEALAHHEKMLRDFVRGLRTAFEQRAIEPRTVAQVVGEAIAPRIRRVLRQHERKRERDHDADQHASPCATGRRRSAGRRGPTRSSS